MGRWITEDQKIYIGLSVMMVLTGFIPFLTYDVKMLRIEHWLELLYHFFLIAFIGLHIWLATRGKRFGHLHTLSYIFSIGLILGFVVIMVLYSVEKMSINYQGDRIFSVLQWFGISFFLFITPILFTLLFFIFSERDLKYEQRRFRLPVSRYAEWKDETSVWIRPDDIVEIYPRWTYMIVNQGKFTKPPTMGAKKRDGLGFRIRDGRRFGYELTSRIILEEEMGQILGRERFEELLVDHSRLDKSELDLLKEDISHWYSNHESAQLKIGIGILAVFFFQAVTMTLMKDNLDIWMPFFIISSIVIFGYAMMIMGKAMKKWFFIKGTIFRMIDSNEKIPEWLEIKGMEFRLKKPS